MSERLAPILAAATVLLGIVSIAPAQDELSVLGPDVAGMPTRKVLNAWLQAEAAKHFDARRQAVAGLTNSEGIRARADELRRKFVVALGGWPEKTPLNGRTVGVIERDGYRIEKVIFESRPGHHMTANLYLPGGKGPFPAVIMPCGHSADGKASGSYQRLAVMLARNGIAAMPYDPIGQAERRQVLDADGKPAIRSMTTEHSLLGVSALLVGECTASYRIWDGIRALDYLAGRPEIDATKLGCTGCSGGGTLTSYLMALDDRIAAAAPSCYVTSLQRLFATIGPQDAEQNIPGQVAFGMEHADYLTMRLPKPTLICAATKDFFDIDGTWTSFREAKRLYTIAGFPERIEIVESPGGHGYPKEHREAIARFMSRRLLGKDVAIVEPEMQVLPERELWCTQSGQVLTDLKGRSVPDIIAERAEACARERGAGLDQAALVGKLRELLALGAEAPQATRRDLGEVRRDGYTIRKFAYDVPGHPPVPALLFAAEKAAADQPLVLYVHGLGKSADAAPGGPIEAMVRSGKRVLAVDLPGFGETSPAKPPALAEKMGTFGADFSESFLAMHIARPLLGQRVADLLAVIEAEAKDAAGGVELHAIGAAGPVALHAAVLDKRVRSVTIEGAVISWDAVARTPHQRNQLTNVIPGVLGHYDLPDLAAALAPRPLTIRKAAGPDTNALPPEAIIAAHARAAETYQAAGAKGAFRIE